MNSSLADFQDLVWDYYGKHGRDLAWRNADPDGSFDPYKILVSEIMLQQTQVSRVLVKYKEFLAAFPDVTSLARADLAAVLIVWSGLGYNRRAKFLWQAARQVVDEYSGVFPSTAKKLTALPGVGINTAGAIMAYAFNAPAVFIETNIRTVYINHFFQDRDMVSDSQIIELVTATVDTEHPREWYWALMDYGVYIKSTIGNVSRTSKHYVRQSKFEGSKRQIRGAVIRTLTKAPGTKQELSAIIVDGRLGVVLQDLLSEELIRLDHGIYSI